MVQRFSIFRVRTCTELVAFDLVSQKSQGLFAQVNDSRFFFVNFEFEIILEPFLCRTVPCFCVFFIVREDYEVIRVSNQDAFLESGLKKSPEPVAVFLPKAWIRLLLCAHPFIQLIEVNIGKQR